MGYRSCYCSVVVDTWLAVTLTRVVACVFLYDLAAWCFKSLHLLQDTVNGSVRTRRYQPQPARKVCTGVNSSTYRLRSLDVCKSWECWIINVSVTLVLALMVHPYDCSLLGGEHSKVFSFFQGVFKVFVGSTSMWLIQFYCRKWKIKLFNLEDMWYKNPRHNE